ncbi:hypothetical protein Ddye_014744 [Dipteronia dyeriana]|uniref:Uncharacterized protein n=1 Tax=Dipteronia dyeriana TaxID=168575 RepID=A0AAD9X8Y1_9ROSI|nr:hypothetical protein Ddye_014744 [Dipteronia dyeriana]
MGGMIGEPLAVEEDTQSRRLDIGRVLVQVPHDLKCPKKIKVKMGVISLFVQVSEDPVPVDLPWFENLLGLIPMGKDDGDFPSFVCDHVEGGKCESRDVGQPKHKDKMSRKSDGELFSHKKLSSKGYVKLIYKNGKNSKVGDHIIIDLKKGKEANGPGLRDWIVNFKETEDGLKKGPSEEVIEGKLTGPNDPPLSGKKDVIDITERKYCSVELERKPTMVRSSSFHDKIQHQICEVKNKVGWSLEEEIVKVLEKAVAFDHGACFSFSVVSSAPVIVGYQVGCGSLDWRICCGQFSGCCFSLRCSFVLGDFGFVASSRVGFVFFFLVSLLRFFRFA